MTLKNTAWNGPLIVLSFNNNDRVGQIASKYLGTLTLTSKNGRNLQPANIQKALELCNKKLDFLSQNNGALQEGKEVVVNEKLDLKLTKANWTAYLEALIRGLSGACGSALSSNYISENLSVALTLCALVQKFESVTKDQKLSAKLFEMSVRFLRYIDLSSYDLSEIEASLGGGKILTQAPEKYKEFESKSDSLQPTRSTIHDFCKDTLKSLATQISLKTIHWKNRVRL